MNEVLLLDYSGRDIYSILFPPVTQPFLHQLLDALVGQLREEAHEAELDDGEDEVFVHVMIPEDVQDVFDLGQHLLPLFLFRFYLRITTLTRSQCEISPRDNRRDDVE